MRSDTITIREARLDDAKAIARLYVESWRDTYPGILPARALLAMDVEQQAARWRKIIGAPERESVLVAEGVRQTVLGVASLGRAGDTGLGCDGEIYTLYVDPAATGKGIGRKLLGAGFAALAENGFGSCVI